MKEQVVKEDGRADRRDEVENPGQRVFDRAKSFSRQWFALDGDLFTSRLDVPEADRETFDTMTAELVDMRLYEHSATKQRFADDVLPFAAPIELNVSPANDAQAPLSAILIKHNGELTAKALWNYSGLNIQDFYQQLKIEMANRWIVEPEKAGMRELEAG